MALPWKLLVYLSADNSLYNDAQISLSEIVTASLSSAVEAIVQVDGPDGRLASRYMCRAGNKTLIWEAPDGYTDDPRTRLADFLDASVSHPVEPKRVFLILWGHGAGLDHLYLYDKNSGTLLTHQNTRDRRIEDAGHSSIANPESHFSISPMDVLNQGNANRYVNNVALAEVLDGFSKSMNRKVDLLGFDACLMGMVEICYEVRNSTAAVIASDEEVPEGSWPYAEILGDLAQSPCMDRNALAAIVVTRYIERYSMRRYRKRVSLSGYDLSASDSLADSMKSLVTALAPAAHDGTMRRKIFRARDSSRTPDEAAYIDLAVFCSELLNSFPPDSELASHAQSVIETLSQDPFLIYHRDASETRAMKSSGAAIYFPEFLSPTEGAIREFTAANQLEIRTFKPTRQDGAGKKFPPGSDKFPPGSDKFPPGSDKFPPGSDKRPHIVGYEILWDHYVQLQFCKATGWASFVESLVKAGY